MPITTSVADLDSAKVRKLHAYWSGLRGARAAPRRAEIDPADIRDLLPNLIIGQVERDPFRIRYRLVGTRVAEVTGCDFTGKYLDEIALPEDEGDFEECYRRAATDRIPVFDRPVWHLDAWTALRYDFGVFPLSDDGETVDRVLAIECYDSLERHPAVAKRLRRGSF